MAISHRIQLTLVTTLVVAACLPVFARETTCVAFENSPLKSWEDLPPVKATELPGRTEAAIQNHPLTTSLRELYGTGRGLIFESDLRIHYRNGWSIQAEFLNKVIKAVFPEATISEFRSGKPTRILLDLEDRAEGDRLREPNKFSMNELKASNFGIALPPKATLRSQLGLPSDSQIVSVYSAVLGQNRTAPIIARLFSEKLADIVILSAQKFEASTVDKVETALLNRDIPVMNSRDWTALEPSKRPQKAVIINTTRSRMPYMHAASDLAVVIGDGNILEPIYAGRPSYFLRSPYVQSVSTRWNELVDLALETRAAYPFITDQGLVKLIRRVGTQRPAVRAQVDEVAVGRVLSRLQRVLDSHFAEREL